MLIVVEWNILGGGLRSGSYVSFRFNTPMFLVKKSIIIDYFCILFKAY